MRYAHFFLLRILTHPACSLTVYFNNHIHNPTYYSECIVTLDLVNLIELYLSDCLRNDDRIPFSWLTVSATPSPPSVSIEPLQRFNAVLLDSRHSLAHLRPPTRGRQDLCIQTPAPMMSQSARQQLDFFSRSKSAVNIYIVNRSYFT